MDNKALLRINSLLKHINFVIADTKNVDISNLKEDSVIFRATCFSIAQIGEQMARLQEKIGDKYPKLPWQYARQMRNFLIHDYEKVDPGLVSETVINDLPLLKEEFLKIKKDFEKNAA